MSKHVAFTEMDCAPIASDSREGVHSKYTGALYVSTSLENAGSTFACVMLLHALVSMLASLASALATSLVRFIVYVRVVVRS